MWKRVSVLWSLVRGDARLLWRALKHPDAPRWLKPATLLLAAYVLWPIDFIPEFVPLLGVVDDLVLVPLAIRFILARLPAELRDEIERPASPAQPIRPGPTAS